MLREPMRLCIPCAECAFENPRGWVGCARCGALLGPRLRRLEDSSTHITTATVHRDEVAAAEAEAEAEADEKTSVFAPGGAKPAASAAPSADAERPSRPPSLLDSRPLLGRDDAAKTVSRAIGEAFERAEARLCVLHGELGTGRSRMLQRASELAARRAPDVAVHYAALRSRDDGPYAPLSRLLLERFGVTPASSPSQVRAEMEQLVADVLELPRGGATEATHLIGHVAGVPFPDSAVLRELPARELRRRAIAAVTRFVTGEARQAPQLFLLDDIDEADDGAIELLSALLGLRARIAIVATGRGAIAEIAARMANAERVIEIPLSPLTTVDAEAVVRALVPDLLDLPAELPSLLMMRTGGNPQQLVEAVRGLEAARVFRRSERGATVDAARLAEGALPTTLGESLRARLSALAPAELSVVRDAALIGERFWDGALLALQRARSEKASATLPALEVVSRTEDALALQATLDALEAKGFVVRIADAPLPGLGELTFQYARARALIYAELDPDERARGHVVIAQWLELNAAYALEGHDALLGAHLEHGGDKPRAAAAYVRASNAERSRMRTTMALLYVEKALAVIPGDDVPARIDAMHQRGSLLATLGRYDEALSVFHQTARLAWSRAAGARCAAALNRIARIHRDRGELERSLEHLHEALNLFRAAGDTRGIASSYDDIAQVHRMLGELEQALAAAEQAFAIRKDGADARAQALSLNTLGRIELDLGRFDSAETRFKTALQVREGLRDHEGAVQTRSALGQLAFRRGQVDQAISSYESALQAAREMNHQHFQTQLLISLGVALAAKGELERAEATLRDARRIGTALGDQSALSDIERHLLALQARRASTAPQPGS